MKKALTKKIESVELVPTSDKIKKVRDFFNDTELNQYNPEKLFVKYFDLMGVRPRNKKRSDDEIIELHNTGDKVMFALDLKTHFALTESVDEEYKYLITEMIACVVQEYACTTATEKSLAEMIALSHVRVLSLAKTMSAYGAGRVSINKEINDYYQIISKELDRAQRQLTGAIMALRQIKMPHMSLNINAKTAFIAHNQQINES